jgi:alpha-L-arabinofuranosidase
MDGGLLQVCQRPLVLAILNLDYIMLRLRTSNTFGGIVFALGFGVTAFFFPGQGQAVNYHVERIAAGLAQPTFLAQSPGDSANIVYYSTRITAPIGSGGGFGAVNNMGGIFRYDMNTRTSTEVMNLSHRQLTGDEGLVGFAFSPDFSIPGAPGYQKLYVSSSQLNGSGSPIERVEEYTVNGLGGTVPLDGSGHPIVSRLLLQYENVKTDPNHTVDWIGFDPTAPSLPVGAPDRNYLYIAAGDGDIGGNAQSRPEQQANTVQGKVLRVDVDVANHGDAYPTDPNKNFAIPATNPIALWNSSHSGSEQLAGTHINFTGGSPLSADYTPALSELFFTGTRNTFRMSIDRQTGDYWMGDVGENAREEINFLKAGTYDGTQPPIDFGYAQREGTIPTSGGLAVANSAGSTSLEWNLSGGGSVTVDSVNPVREGDHSTTNTNDHPLAPRSSYIGGYVYRGPISELQGQYVYADFVHSNVFTLSDFDRDIPLSSYSGTKFNQDSTTQLASLGTRSTVASADINSLWNSLIVDPTDPSYTSALGSDFGIGRVVSFGEDNSGNLYVIDFGGTRGDPSFGSDYANAGEGQIFMLVPNFAIKLTVDRDSGEMSFSNATGEPVDVRGYTILSAKGAIDLDQLTPVTGRLDAMPNGNGTIDPNNFWEVTSDSDDMQVFSEASTGSAAGLDADEGFVLSPGDGWIQSIYEDLSLKVVLGDGSEVTAMVDFVGNDDLPFQRSDLNFDGVVGPADWPIFRDHHLMNLSGMSPAQSYQFGDLDGDGDNDFADFRLFQGDYISHNGAASFARLLRVPEPTSVALWLTCVVAVTCYGRRRWPRKHLWLASTVAAYACLLAANSDADLVRQYTFNEGTAEDAIGSADGTLNGNATIDFGGLELSGDAGAYLSLPAATIGISSFTDTTIEAWFTFRGGDAWQRIFDFGRSLGGGGRDYLFYSPNSGFGDNRAVLRDNNLAEDTAIGGLTLSINTPHHVAVVVDDDANGGTNRMSVYVDGEFGGDVGLDYSLSDLSNSQAYLGRSLFSNDPYFNGRIDEFRIYNNALTATEVHDSFVAGPVVADLLHLDVNTVTGAVTLSNQHTVPLTFDYYRIGSESGALEPATWNSLDQQNANAIGSDEGESWDELGSPNSQLVAESFLLSGSILAPSATLDLGRLYDPSVVGTRQEGDLVFQYALQGENQLRQGVTTYVIPPPLPGDYNDNGVVDAADYTVWRNHLNTSYQLPNEVEGVSDGTVTLADYDAWKERFGDVLSGSGAGGVAVAVPEPTSAWLVAIALWVCNVWRRGRGGRYLLGWFCLVASIGVVAHGAEPKARITIDTCAAGTPVPATLHGIFFEDINYGADGGLYAELIQNRSFEHADPRYAWTALGSGDNGPFEISDESPLNANNPHFARISADEGTGDRGLVNSGFDGIALQAGEKYLVSLYARAKPAGASSVVVRLEDASGETIAVHKFSNLTLTWQKLEAQLLSTQSIADGRLAVLVSGGGTVDLDMVSLFPQQTFKNRRNGLRRDLAQALADLKPGFFRFPGGCIVEGMDLDNAYRWKDTIGDVAERKQNYNLWRDQRSPQYQQTYGLGFFEYFQFCEDIGAEPVPVINCGMCCQARRRGAHVPLAELGPWIHDALDLIEFANGPESSEWGAKRAAMGHPQSFGLKFLAVGNEQWNEEYFERYMPFYEAIKRQHPEIQIISSAGPRLSDDRYRLAWDRFRGGTPADVVDEHYYVPPQWLLENPDWYATYDPHGPKIFVGEFAGHDGRGRRNNLRAALAEAAYMTGLVRHSDVVLMASYAPLFGKYGHDQWHPNLIWFDNSRVVLTPSYYAQALFSQNRPDVALPIDVKSDVVSRSSSGMIGVGTWNTQAEYKDITVTTPDGELLYQSDFTNPDELDRWQTAGGSWELHHGALRQNAIATDVRALVGDPRWTDYTLKLKARKLSGDEGFLILFHSADLEKPIWWNIGGWNNTSHAIQESEFPESHVRGRVETGRWYDIRIELMGGTVKAYLDDQLIHSAKAGSARQLYAAAGLDRSAQELVIEIVNPTNRACDVAIDLEGYAAGSPEAKLTRLTADSPDRENSLNDQERVVPRDSTISDVAATFTHTVPPNTLDVLRIPQSQP